MKLLDTIRKDTVCSMKDTAPRARRRAPPSRRAYRTFVRNWYEYILNSFDVPYSNGFTEGCNNKTKVLKRVCFGVRSFLTFRNSILHCVS